MANEMIDKHIREKIEARAFEIYEWRKENNVPGSAESDWFQAEAEIITDRRQEGCPKYGYKLLARNDSEIFCLKDGCDWKIKAKREYDKDIPDFEEIKKDWR